MTNTFVMQPLCLSGMDVWKKKALLRIASDKNRPDDDEI